MDEEIKEKLGIMNKEINYLRKKIDRIDGIITEIRENLSELPYYEEGGWYYENK